MTENTDEKTARLKRLLHLAKKRARAYRSAVSAVRRMYPKTVFPPQSNTTDSKTADFARQLCDYIDQLAEKFSR